MWWRNSGQEGSQPGSPTLPVMPGPSPAQAILTGTRAAGTVMAIFFAAVSAYH